MNNSEKTSLNDVTTVLNRWYFSRINSDAAEYVRLFHASEFETADEMTDRIMQDASDADLVIYTYQARLVCAASERISEAKDELSETGCDQNITPEMLASLCYRLDLTAQIEAELGASIDAAFDAREVVS